jgi:hypothetical protein
MNCPKCGTVMRKKTECVSNRTPYIVTSTSCSTTTTGGYSGYSSNTTEGFSPRLKREIIGTEVLECPQCHCKRVVKKGFSERDAEENDPTE